MPFRRRIARVSRRAFTARSTGTSPQITSLTLLPEPPKSSPTVPLKNAPDLPLLSYSIQNGRTRSVLGTRDGYNILVSARGETIHAEEEKLLIGEPVILRPPRDSDVEAVYRWDKDPELPAGNGPPPTPISPPPARRDYLAR